MVNLNLINKIYFVGIKGVAMTSLAIIAKKMGKEVFGSDVTDIFPTDSVLKRFKISYKSGFSSQNINSDIDLVIYTGAHNGSNNLEVLEAKKKNIPIMSHGEALGLFMKGYSGISVAGSHGKTTASAMIAHILNKSGFDPSFAIGCGEILSLKTPAHFGKGKYFVAEADEYVTDPQVNNKPRFLWQYPEMLLITNIDFDHPDVYPNIKEVQDAFIKFTNNVSHAGFVVCNLDNLETRQILPKINKKIITYGTNDKADFILNKIKIENHQSLFNVKCKGKQIDDFILKIPGNHNILNAVGVIAILMTLGIPIENIKSELASFKGTKRRFEFIGEKNNIFLYDDYAHHPVEISASLKAAREWFPKKRIIVIFQPHTCSRTLSLLKQFGQCFSDADIVVISDIYTSAREKTLPGVSGKTLYQEVLKSQKCVYYAPKLPDVLEYLKSNSKAGDLIITQGAGDIYSWIDSIYRNL